MMIAAEWGTGQVLWSMLWFFMFVIWIWMIIVIFSGHLPQRGPERMGEGDLVDLHHLAAVPRHLRLPHRPWRRHGRTIRPGSPGGERGDAGLHPRRRSGVVGRGPAGEARRPAHRRQDRRRRVRLGKGEGHRLIPRRLTQGAFLATLAPADTRLDRHIGVDRVVDRRRVRRRWRRLRCVVQPATPHRCRELGALRVGRPATSVGPRR